MKIHVRYLAQLKRAAGVGQETIELPDEVGLAELLNHLGQIHGDALRTHLFDENQSRRRSLLVSLEDRMITAEESVSLRDGCTITLMTPMSGG